MAATDIPSRGPRRAGGAGSSSADPSSRGSSSRGRPMSERTDEAILDAALALLEEGSLGDMTMDDVAARAHVSKASVYRRWPSKGTLAFDAFMVDFVGRQPEVDTGSLAGDLRAALRGWVRAVRRPTTARTLRGLIAEVQRDPELAGAWRDRFVEPVRHRHHQILERADARGELSPDVDAEVLLDLLYGPAYHRLLHGHRPLTDRFVDQVAAAVAQAASTGPPA